MQTTELNDLFTVKQVAEIMKYNLHYSLLVTIICACWMVPWEITDFTSHPMSRNIFNFLKVSVGLVGLDANLVIALM